MNDCYSNAIKITNAETTSIEQMFIDISYSTFIQRQSKINVLFYKNKLLRLFRLV